jgi:hypothetical protein
MTNSDICNSERCRFSKSHNLSEFVIFVQPRILEILSQILHAGRSYHRLHLDFFSEFFIILKYDFRFFEKNELHVARGTKILSRPRRPTPSTYIRFSHILYIGCVRGSGTVMTCTLESKTTADIKAYLDLVA